MKDESQRNAQVALGMKVVAAIIAAVPIIHGFTGYYTSDLGWMLVMLVVAFVLYFVADRIG